MKDKEFRVELIARRNRLREQIKVLQQKLDAANILLEDSPYSSSQESSSKNEESFLGGKNDVVLGPRAAIWHLFLQNPPRLLTPPELRDKLEIMIDEQTAKSESENLLSGVHTVLRALVEDGLVEKIGLGYRVSEKESGASVATAK